MSQRVSTAGMYLAYCVETTAGTMPTTNYIKIPEVKSMPSLNPAPNGIDVTPLSEEETIQYINGLKDFGGSLEFSANNTDDVYTAWTTLISAYAAGQAATTAKNTWFCIYHPKLSNAAFFKGEPAPFGWDGAEVNAAYNTTLYIAPQSAPTYATAPTFASA